MKAADEISIEAKQESNTKKPIKVYMHVLRKAKTDIRAMRDASALVEAGFSVSIIDVECEGTSPEEEYIGNIQMKHMIIPNWFSARRFAPWFFLVALRVFVLSIRLLLQSQADIYHANELTALPASYIAAMVRRKPLIFEAYELHMPGPETEVAFWRLLGRIFMHLLAVILPQCAGIITVSPPIAQQIRNRYHVKDVVLLRNVPYYQTVAKSDRLRQYLGLPSETRIALYQGILHSERGLKELISAASFLKQDIVIIIMGNGPNEVISELTSLIAHEGVDNRVKIIPAVPYEELLSWTISADIGLIIYPPNYSLNVQGCLPNKFFEYLMAGLPVLASQLAAVAEAIRTYDVGQVVSSLEPAAVGAAINAMLDDHDALARMQRNALEAAKQEFNWEKEKEKLLHLYHRLSSTTGNRENSV